MASQPISSRWWSFLYQPPRPRPELVPRAHGLRDEELQRVYWDTVAAVWPLVRRKPTRRRRRPAA
jgi:hypothetical protein